MNNKRKIRNKIDPNLRVREIEPKTKNQERVMSSDKNKVLHGSAGTGKTFLSSFIGIKKVLRGEYDSLIYVRSVVPTRNIGFLPGTEQEKVQVYEQPYREVMSELFERGDAYDTLKNSNVIKFTTTSHIRGVTLNNAVIIIDECQNMTFQELDSVFTRFGPNTLIFFCGDFYQRDLKDTGIREFYDILKSMGEFDFINFTIDDVVRSELVKNYLRAKYEKGGYQQSNLSERRPIIKELSTRGVDVSGTELQQSCESDSNSELWNGPAGLDDAASRAS